MSFGGAVSAMITSLKNNKRSRKSTFEMLERTGSINNQSQKLVFENEASSAQLLEIKKKTQLENRKTFINNAIIFTVSLALLIASIGFVSFYYFNKNLF